MEKEKQHLPRFKWGSEGGQGQQKFERCKLGYGQDDDLRHRNQELIMAIPRGPSKAPVNWWGLSV